MHPVRHRYINCNEIRMHLAEQGGGRFVVLCHGWPESWFSWRHQMAALADAGYLSRCAGPARLWQLMPRRRSSLSHPASDRRHRRPRSCARRGAGSDSRARLGIGRRLVLRAASARTVPAARSAERALSSAELERPSPDRGDAAVRGRRSRVSIGSAYFQKPGRAEAELKPMSARRSWHSSVAVVPALVPVRPSFARTAVCLPVSAGRRHLTGSARRTSTSTFRSTAAPASGAGSTGIATSTGFGNSMFFWAAPGSGSPRCSSQASTTRWCGTCTGLRSMLCRRRCRG